MSFQCCGESGDRAMLEPHQPAALHVDVDFDDRYRLRRLLAISSGAVVYAGEHVYTRRSVAVKLPRSGFVDERTKMRFRREVEALAWVRGEGIVELLDAGQFAGRPYIVLELLEGRTLAGLLTARGRFAPGDAVRIGIRIARSLARCHEKGVVHRDIKPGNVFVSRVGSDMQVTLFDFGIAQFSPVSPSLRPLDSARDAADRFVLLGTPEYMAPEALLSMPVDQRADIYGFGVTLHECLTGCVPYEGGYAEVLRKVSSTTTGLGEALRGIPANLRALVERCLARPPEARFQNVGELLAALEACRDSVDIGLGVDQFPAAAGNRVQVDTVADSPIAKQSQRSVSRRRHPRAPYTTLARLTHSDSSFIDGRLEEVSEGGLQLIASRGVPTGEIVRIRFALPATGRITEVTAIARWSRGARGSNATGFEFAEIPDAARTELRKYAEIMCPEASGADPSEPRR